MNWGTSIALFFAAFAISMVTAVIATTRHAPQMVQKDYYLLDINYPERMARKENTAALATPPQATFDAGQQSLNVLLPTGMVASNIRAKCYRSATSQDDILTTATQAASMAIPMTNTPKGRWHLELEWETSGDKGYFWETTFEAI